jgi:toxin YoeB
MRISFTPEALREYVEWQSEDKKTLKKINALLFDIMRNPYEGMGKPEALKHEFSGCWSRRIDDKNRLIYLTDDGGIIVIHCRGHY